MLLVLLVTTLLQIVASEVPFVSSDRSCNGLTSCLDYAVSMVSNTRDNLLKSFWFDEINMTNHSYEETNRSSDKNNYNLVGSNSSDTNHESVIKSDSESFAEFKSDKSEVFLNMDERVKREGRTFGLGKRRVMLTLLPIMYKLGVITTLLVVLTVITLKGLTVGVILLTLSLAKLKVGDGDLQKEVHYHVHPFHSKSKYSPWGRVGDEMEVTTSAPSAYLPQFLSL